MHENEEDVPIAVLPPEVLNQMGRTLASEILSSQQLKSIADMFELLRQGSAVCNGSAFWRCPLIVAFLQELL